MNRGIFILGFFISQSYLVNIRTNQLLGLPMWFNVVGLITGYILIMVSLGKEKC